MNFKMLSILSRLPVAIYLDICIISAALLIQTINYIYQDFFSLLIHTWPRLKENIIFCKIPYNIISICEHQYQVESFMNFVAFDIWQSKKCMFINYISGDPSIKYIDSNVFLLILSKSFNMPNIKITLTHMDLLSSYK